jgi:putative tricarboxylic transport membrane protein
MKKYDFMSSLAWMIIAALFCGGSINLGLGDLRDPGPGFFPFVMSAFIFLFALLVLIFSLTGRKGYDSASEKKFRPEGDGIKRISLTIGALFMYVFLLDYLGFVLCAFLFIFFLLRFIEPQKWTTVFCGAGLTAVLSYTIFEIWLKVQMPIGPLGF